jgi:hypothetical protein
VLDLSWSCNVVFTLCCHLRVYIMTILIKLTRMFALYRRPSKKELKQFRFLLAAHGVLLLVKLTHVFANANFIRPVGLQPVQAGSTQWSIQR